MHLDNTDYSYGSAHAHATNPEQCFHCVLNSTSKCTKLHR